MSLVFPISRTALGIACVAAVVGASLLLTGCGSSGHTVALSRQAIAPDGYFGRYYIADSFPAGDFTANLTMSVSKDGTASGTLFLYETATSKTKASTTKKRLGKNMTRQADEQEDGQGNDQDGSEGGSEGGGPAVTTGVVTGVVTGLGSTSPNAVSLTGTFDRATGAFTLSGAYLVGGDAVVPVTITGTLPPPPALAGGTISTTINGNAYPAKFIQSISTVLPIIPAIPVP